MYSIRKPGLIPNSILEFKYKNMLNEIQKLEIRLNSFLLSPPEDINRLLSCRSKLSLKRSQIVRLKDEMIRRNKQNIQYGGEILFEII